MFICFRDFIRCIFLSKRYSNEHPDVIDEGAMCESYYKREEEKKKVRKPVRHVLF